MEIHQLRYFVAVVEAGTISRAAERCGVAQPSLSQQIRKLETDLGASLFDRVGRRVELTDAGRALVPRARRILAEVREARENLLDDVEHGVGSATFAAIPTMAPYLLPSAIHRLRSELPGLDVEVREDVTERLVEAIADGSVDAAIMSTPIDHELIQLEVVGAESMLVVVGADHALASRERIAPEALRREPAVTLQEMHCLSRQIREFCSAHRAAGLVSCRTTQIPTVLELVRLGMGLSIVPEMAARVDEHPGRRYLPFKGPPPRREIAIAWRRDRTRSLGIRRLIEIVRADLASGRHGYPAEDGDSTTRAGRRSRSGAGRSSA